ncbi:MAG: GNAT family N-acetyltransferase [Prevotellaceae bacterium]|nr:GNAT family N-acetyltransferase [Prevotellaceae bacterium]MDY3365073.1 GNAT family N-acetyltransferase [Prevotella sp.]
MNITTAKPTQASQIAKLIMEAMNHECCQYFAGEHHTLADFHRVLTELVRADNSQYSYRNALVALTADEKVAGVCVSYDGACLIELRKAFLKACKENFNQDFSDMPEETSAGELYIDSIAVDEGYRGQGLAKQLLQATIDKARDMNINSVGLLVDKGNPQAEQLYHAVGFRYENDNMWGGHPMKHLVYTIASVRE